MLFTDRLIPPLLLPPAMSYVTSVITTRTCLIGTVTRDSSCFALLTLRMLFQFNVFLSVFELCRAEPRWWWRALIFRSPKITVLPLPIVLASMLREWHLPAAYRDYQHSYLCISGRLVNVIMKFKSTLISLQMIIIKDIKDKVPIRIWPITCTWIPNSQSLYSVQ